MQLKIMIGVRTWIILLICHPLGQAAEFIIQPGPAAGKDAEVWDLPPGSAYAVQSGLNMNVNEGNKPYIRAACWTYYGVEARHRSFVQFDLTDLPDERNLSSAELTLYSQTSNNQTQSGANQFLIHRVTEPWDEMQIIWDNQPAFASEVRGRDYVYVPVSTSEDQDFIIDVTDMARYWIAHPAVNFGMMLRLQSESPLARAFFASSDYDQPGRRPKLVVRFDDGSQDNGQPPGTASGEWDETVLDDFEQDFGWPRWDRYATSGGYTWGQSKVHAASGLYSIWCAEKNTPGYPELNPATDNYPVSFGAWAVYRELLDLRNCEDAEIVFNVWHKMADTDKLRVIAHRGDGAWQGFTFTGSSSSLEEKHLSFSNWNGQNWMGTRVILALVFESNSSGTQKGAFIDYVRFRRRITGRPDLMVQDLDFSPGYQPPGGLIDIRAVLKNIGTFKNSITSRTCYYLSEDPVISPDQDILIGSIYTGKTYVNQPDTVNRYCLLPKNLEYGDYHVGVYYDPEMLVQELSTDNNGAAAAGILHVGPESTDWEVLFSEDFEQVLPMNQWDIHRLSGGLYYWGVTNSMSYMGSGSAWCVGGTDRPPELIPDPTMDPVPDASMYHSSYLIHSPPAELFDCNDAEVILYARLESGALQVIADPGGWDPEGETFTHSAPEWMELVYSLKDWPGHGNLMGHHVYCGVMHEGGQGGKGAFIDNFVIRKKLNARPDLFTDRIQCAVNTVRQGEPLVLDVVIQNIGQAGSPDSDIHFYLSSDSKLDPEDDAIGSGVIPPLDPGESMNLPFEILLSASPPAGDYSLIALIDSANVITERLEGNNITVMQEPVTISGPIQAVLIQTSPADIPIRVDGVQSSGSRTMEWDSGSLHTVTADSHVVFTENCRYTFTGWSDDGAISHQIEALSGVEQLTAYFTIEYMLQIQSEHGTTGGGWIQAGETAGFAVDSLIFKDATRYCFTGWTGDFTGSNRSGEIVMTGPKSITANWQTQVLIFLTVQDQIGGTVFPQDSVWIARGGALQIQAVPDTASGYAFKMWRGDIENEYASLTLIADHPLIVIAVFEMPSAITEPEIPAAYALRQNVPNPFNPETMISYDIPEPGETLLQIYDVRGRLVRTLINAFHQPGFYQTVWDGRNDRGEPVGTGTYVYLIKSGKFIGKMKAVFLK
jgi:hypothetical protein